MAVGSGALDKAAVELKPGDVEWDANQGRFKALVEQLRMGDLRQWGPLPLPDPKKPGFDALVEKLFSAIAQQRTSQQLADATAEDPPALASAAADALPAPAPAPAPPLPTRHVASEVETTDHGSDAEGQPLSAKAAPRKGSRRKDKARGGAAAAGAAVPQPGADGCAELVAQLQTALDAKPVDVFTAELALEKLKEWPGPKHPPQCLRELIKVNGKYKDLLSDGRCQRLKKLAEDLDDHWME